MSVTLTGGQSNSKMYGGITQRTPWFCIWLFHLF